MTYSKIGFHSGPTGNMSGIGEFWRKLANAGIPIFHKAADGFGPLYEIAELMPNPHGIEHHLVYRMSTRGQDDGYDYDVPPYHLTAEAAAEMHWQVSRANLPPEFNKAKVWLEPINEIDKNRCDWLGWFAWHIANLAHAEGYKVTLFGWSSGEPEPSGWETEGMLKYLRLCGERPNQAAVSTHEYNWHRRPFAEVYPHHVGRFLKIHETCDRHNIPYPTIHITEWGWALNSVPSWAQAEPYITACNEFYAKYPNVKGCAIWNLGAGPEFGNVHNETQRLIAPLGDYTLTHTFDGGDGGNGSNPPPPSPAQTRSFEDGHTDHPIYSDRIQIPTGFDVTVVKPGQPLWFKRNGQVVQATGTVEAKRLECGRQLPVTQCKDGIDRLILDGLWDYKIQAVNMQSGTSLVTTFEGNGRYRVTVPINVHWQGDTPREVDDVYVVLRLNGVEVDRLQHPELKDRRWMELSGEADGPVTAELHFQTSWENSRDVFTDLWQCERMETPGPCRGLPRVQYNRVYWVVPGDATEFERLEIYRLAALAQVTCGPSFDDAGGGDLDNKTAVPFGIPLIRHPEFTHWFDTHYPGTVVEFRPMSGAGSSERSKLKQKLTSVVNRAKRLLSSGCRGLPRVQYKRVYWVVPPHATEAQRLEIYRLAALAQVTCGPSYDDAGVTDLIDKTAVLFGIPTVEQSVFTNWYATHYPGTKVEFRPLPVGFKFTHWPVESAVITQDFGANPQNYQQYGLPGHEGIDFKAPHGSKIFAVASGVVSNRRDEATGHNYGRFIRIRHGDSGYETTYAHLNSIEAGLPVGTAVVGGQIIGRADNTGNSFGSHLHLTAKHVEAYPGGAMYIGYPHNIINPMPLMPNPPAPPASGNAGFGLHASADSWNMTGDVDMAQAARPVCMKVLSGHAPLDVQRLHQVTQATDWVVRAFLSFRGRTEPVTPQQFYDWTFSDVQRTVQVLVARGVPLSKIWVELHNEPNLTDEGLDVSWGNGNEFKDWFLSVLAKYRHGLPGVKYLYPGLSPGPNTTWAGGRRLGHRAFWVDTAVNAADGLAIHSYWSPGYPMDSHPDAGFALVDEAIGRFAGKPIWITEACNSSGAVTPGAKAQEYITFWRGLRQRPLVRGVTYYVLSASDPAWQWGSGGSGEVWTMAMAQAAGARTVT